MPHLTPSSCCNHTLRCSSRVGAHSMRHTRQKPFSSQHDRQKPSDVSKCGRPCRTTPGAFFHALRLFYNTRCLLRFRAASEQQCHGLEQVSFEKIFAKVRTRKRNSQIWECPAESLQTEAAVSIPIPRVPFWNFWWAYGSSQPQIKSGHSLQRGHDVERRLQDRPGREVLSTEHEASHKKARLRVQHSARHRANNS